VIDVVHVSVPNYEVKLKWFLIKVVPEGLEGEKGHNVAPEGCMPIPGSRGCVFTLDCFFVDAFDAVVRHFNQGEFTVLPARITCWNKGILMPVSSPSIAHGVKHMEFNAHA
jgi:hypothetical protein